MTEKEILERIVELGCCDEKIDFTCKECPFSYGGCGNDDEVERAKALLKEKYGEEEMKTIGDLFNVLSDYVTRIEVNVDGIMCLDNINRLFLTINPNDNPYDIKNGTYYRPGHEPEKKLVCDAEYLKKRALNGECMYLDDHQLVLDWSDTEVKLSKLSHWSTFEEFSELYKWLDGSPIGEER
jgi:hypothetical protein